MSLTTVTSIWNRLPTKGQLFAQWNLRIDSLVILLALFAAISLGTMLWTRAHYPSLGLLAEPAPGGWRITSISRDTTQGGVPREWLGGTVTRACLPSKPDQCISLQPQWMINTPMALPSATAVSEFVHGQQALLALGSKSGHRVVLHAQLANVNKAAVEVQSTVTLENAREFLSERYAVVLLTAIMIYTVGCAMLAFVRRTREVWLAFAMCMGFSLYMLMRSWYTDRSWAQPEDTWWMVINLFRSGVMVCAVATTMTLWNMRLHNLKTWNPLGLCMVLCTIIVLHSFGAIQSAAWGYRYVTLVFAILILAIALASWWHAKQQLDGRRLRSRTFGQILLIGYLPAVITIPLWTFRPDLPQIAFIQNIAVGLVGIPIVIMVSQSAQYQLHAFWWRLWLVLVVAVVALVESTILVLFSDFSAAASLSIMLFLAALSVFGLRGWLEKKLIGKPPAIEQFLPQLMALQGLQSDSLRKAWRNLLQDAFAPQQITQSPEEPTTVGLLAQGDSLLIPGLGNDTALKLTGAGSFTRSFGPGDERLASSLYTLASQGLQARASYIAGAVQERRRIAADLHDDIGGKLLHLANNSGAEGIYARNTLEDLRTITRGLSAQPRPLTELLADIQYQLGERAERANTELLWEAYLPAADNNILIGARQSTVLTSICSELLRNAMQHEGVMQVQLQIAIVGQSLQLICTNDGVPTNPAEWQSGLGTTSIRRRVHDLHGLCAWQERAGGGASFEATWPLASWLSAETGSFQIDQLGHYPQYWG